MRIASPRYGPILSPTLTELIKFDDLLDDFRINEQCGKRCISIVVLDGTKLRQTQALPDEVKAARRNFLFVPPNTLLIDEYALMEIMLESINDGISLVNFLSMVEHGKGLRKGIDLGTSILLNRTAREYLRAGNIGMFRKEGKLPDDAIAVRDSWQSFASQVPVMASSIAFVFFHEFGHHAHATAGAFDVSFERIKLFLKDQLFTSAVRKEEEEADAYATQLFKPYLRQQVANRIPPIIIYDAAQTLGRNFKAIHYFKMFDDLRGFSYRDLFLTLYHRECEEFASGDTKQRKRSVLNDLDYLVHAEERDMLLLTEEEYQGVRRRLLHSLASTHPYPTSRGDSINAAILSMDEFSDFREGQQAFAKELEVIEAIRSDARSRAGPQLVGSGGALKLNIDDLLGGVRKEFYSIKDAVNCPVERCLIVEFARSAGDPFGYLEFAAAGGTVKLLKLYLRAPLLDIFRKGANYSEDEVKRRLDERLSVLPLVTDLLKLPSREQAMLQMSKVIYQSNLCGASGTILQFDDRTVGITALARKDWIRIDLLGLGEN